MAALLTAWGAASTPFALEPHGASAGVAYLGLVRHRPRPRPVDHHVMAQAREALPTFVRRPLPVGRAGAAIVRDEKLTLASSSR